MTFTVATTYLCVSQPFGEPKHIQYLIVSSIFFFSFIYFHDPYLFALEHIFLETQERDILTKDGANFLSFYCIGPKHQLQQRQHMELGWHYSVLVCGPSTLNQCSAGILPYG